jgi:glycosyltransferase involved in cell wall biosynthesis
VSLVDEGPIPILYVDHAEGLGGAEHSLLLLMRHLAAERYRPLLACNPGPLAAAAQAQGVAVHALGLDRLRGHLDAPWRLLRGGAELSRLIRRENVALVHSNVMRASFYAALASRLAGRPLVWHVRDIHGPAAPGGSWYPRLMCCLAAQTVAISRAVADALPCGSTVVYNAVELGRFDPQADGAALRRHWKVPPEAALVGTVGRMQPWKGHHLFLQAAAQVRDRHPAARFVIVGGRVFAADADYPARLEQMAQELGLDGRVIFAGQRDDVPDCLAAMDVFVHCARAEPFGRVVAEAMAAGRPVVAFADGGVPELVGEVGGVLVPAGDVAALAGALCGLLSDAGRRQLLGQQARRRAEELFAARQMARQVEEIYDRLLDGRRHETGD